MEHYREGGIHLPDGGRVSVHQIAVMLFIMHVVVAVLVAGPVGQASRDAWLAELAINAFQFVLLFVYLALAQRFPGQTLYRVACTLLGRVIGSLIAAAYILFWLVWGAAIVRSLADFVLTTILPGTPIGVILVVFGLLVAYAAGAGIEVLGRAGEAAFSSFLLGLSGIILFVLTRAHWAQVLPILENGLGPVSRSLFASGALFAELSFLPSLCALVQKPSGLRRGLAGMLLASGAALVVMSGVTVMALGDEAGSSMYPVYELSRLIDVADFVQRVEPLFVTVVLIGYFFRSAYFLYACSFTMAEVLGLKNYRRLVWPFLALILTLAVVQFANVDQLKGTFNQRFFPPLAWILELALPAAFLLLSTLLGWFRARPAQ